MTRSIAVIPWNVSVGGRVVGYQPALRAFVTPYIGNRRQGNAAKCARPSTQNRFGGDEFGGEQALVLARRAAAFLPG